MKIFLTGGTGLLGKAFVKMCAERDIDFLAPSSSELNLCDFKAVDNFIKIQKPDLIIHCAAYTAVDLAETEKEACWDLNVEALRHLCSYNLPIIHFSTDYVFDADLDTQPIPTYQPLAPLNYYGQSKAAAEEILEAYDQDWWNIRTTWLYGADGEGFPNKIKKRAESSEPIKVINDQLGRKTLNTDLAEFVLENLSPGFAFKPGLEVGHHHFQSLGPVHTWYDWACELVDPQKITPVSTEDLDLAAKRPKNSVLV